MTRKDYIVLAEALYSASPVTVEYADHPSAVDGVVQWERDVVAIARALEEDNPRMDYDKFFAACKGE